MGACVVETSLSDQVEVANGSSPGTQQLPNVSYRGGMWGNCPTKWVLRQSRGF